MWVFLCVSKTYLIKMFATEQENSCSFSWLNKILSKRNDALNVCLLPTTFFSSLHFQTRKFGKTKWQTVKAVVCVRHRPQWPSSRDWGRLEVLFGTIFLYRRKEVKGSGLSTWGRGSSTSSSFVSRVELLPVLNSTVSGLASPRFHE